MKKLPLKNVLQYHKELSDLPDTYSLERKALSPENLINEEFKIVGIMSTIRCDSDNDILMPNGCDFSRYEKNSVICWNHSLDQKPLGRIENIQVSEKDIRGELKFSESYDEAVTVKNLIKEGILKTLSVGYIPIEILKKGTKAFNDYAAQFKLDVTECARIISKWLIIETSVVAVPANEDALILYSGKNFMSDAMKKSLHIELKGCKEDDKAITEDLPAVSDTEVLPEVLPTVPEEVVEEVVVQETEVIEPALAEPVVETPDILIVEEGMEEIPREIKNEDIPQDVVQNDLLNTILPINKVTQTLVEASKVLPEVSEQQVVKPLVLKVIRVGKMLHDQEIKRKALLYLQGKSF